MQSTLSSQEHQLLLNALESPMLWTLHKTSRASTPAGTMTHANGLILGFEGSWSSDQTLSVEISPLSTRLSLQLPIERVVGHTREHRAISDPKPVLQHEKRGSLLILEKMPAEFSQHDLCHAMNAQTGPLCWHKLRSLMLKAAIAWNAHGWHWSNDEHHQTERLYDPTSPNTTQNLPAEHHLFPVLEYHDLLVFQNDWFFYPKNYRLPTLDQYTAHEKMELLQPWTHTPLPPWLETPLSL